MGHDHLAHALPPPVEGVAEAMSRALSHVDRAVAGPGFDMVGDPVLRARIADRYTARGVPTTADQVMVTLGGQHAIGLLSRTLVRPGDRVLVESPSYPHAYEALLEAGAQLVTTPVTIVRRCSRMTCASFTFSGGTSTSAA